MLAFRGTRDAQTTGWCGSGRARHASMDRDAACRPALGDPVNDCMMTRPQFRIPVLLIAALCFSPARAPAADKPAPAAMELPTFAADSTSIQADEHLQWQIPFTVVNKFTVGMYLDSLFCTVEDLDPGETR